MGLEFRKRSGKIANGSRLVVEGQVTNGQKVFPNTFNRKSNPYDMTSEQRELLISQNTTPPPTPSPTPTPVTNLLLQENGFYLLQEDGSGLIIT
jgi:hypothetical protein